jgi:hypothetical protein
LNILPPKAVADRDAGATPFLASNRGQRLYYCFHSNYSCALVYRGCHRDRCLHSLLLPYLSYLRLHSGFGVLSFGSWSGIDLLDRHRGLLIGDDS